MQACEKPTQKQKLKLGDYLQRAIFSYRALMRYFDNRSINRLYFHSGRQSFAFNGGAVFSYVYLLKAGIANYLVFFTIAAVILSRLVLRLVLLPIVRRIGLRNGLILGTLIEASSFLLLGQVHGHGAWFAEEPFIAVPQERKTE